MVNLRPRCLTFSDAVSSKRRKTEASTATIFRPTPPPEKDFDDEDIEDEEHEKDGYDQPVVTGGL